MATWTLDQIRAAGPQGSGGHSRTMLQHSSGKVRAPLMAYDFLASARTADRGLVTAGSRCSTLLRQFGCLLTSGPLLLPQAAVQKLKFVAHERLEQATPLSGRPELSAAEEAILAAAEPDFSTTGGIADEAAAEAEVGFGRIITLYYRSSHLYHLF
jgi:hypothetical protein